MKVILTDNVKTLGSVGEIVNVSQGYARNYLIPNNKARLADEGNKKQVEDHQKRLAKKVEEQKQAAQEVAKKLQGLTVTLVKKVGGSGKLFGTVTANELSSELEKLGLDVERRLIHIKDSIKSLGQFDVQAKLFKGVEATFKVKVEMDAKQAQEMKEKQAAAEARAAKKGKEAPVEGEATTEEATAEEASEETKA